MLHYLARRVVQLIFVLLAVSTVLFFLLRLSGDPAAMLAGQNASVETIAEIRRSLGFDQPLQVQYVRFMGQVLTLNFGDSISTHQGAMSMVLERVPETLKLTIAAFAFAIVVAFPVGIYAAMRRRSFGASLAMVAALLGQSMPMFWLGILLLLIFSVNLHWLPSFGSAEWRHLILPGITLGSLPLAKLVRLTRSGMLEVLGQDYVRTAHAKGLSPRLVLSRHSVRNTLIPIVTIIGVDLGQLLGGAVIVESIFSWPGVGRLMVQSVLGRDYPVVQASVFVVTILAVLINLFVDIIYRALDPRIKLA
ncbi:MAG: ABC transporter permease [Chloroflexota bacterium]|nr:MAG: ABC transporter permease [Chloroflexota bacterium]